MDTKPVACNDDHDPGHSSIVLTGGGFHKPIYARVKEKRQEQASVSHPWLNWESVWQFYAADHLGMEVFVEHLYDKNGHKGDAIVHEDLATLLVTGSSIICVSYVSFLWQLHNNAKLAVIWSWFCLLIGLQDVSKKFQFSHFLGIQHSCINLVNPCGFFFLRSLIVCFTSSAVGASVRMVTVSKLMSAFVWLSVWCWIVRCRVLVILFFTWDCEEVLNSS